ncbi:polyprenyl synthetase family protein [Paenibacillus sp. MBLB4367]|uniref:polyprenyl synthetase family protein n=1 Tax=Paenibacillus sp. MBLB4367 TaxID=3384767 RepID=UPI00390808DE
MKRVVQEQMNELVDELVHVPGFNSLLKTFIGDKAAEGSRWGEITENVHFMLGGKSPLLLRYAALTEMIILSLDIADDLQDGDNDAKTWCQCPAELALNAVLALLAGTLGELGKLSETGGSEGPNAGLIARIVMRSINGQYRDLAQDVATEADYIAMVSDKSGSLLRLACCMGYTGLNLPEETVSKLDELAGCIGIIAQIDNDLRDLLRIDVKNDLLHKKRTLPVFYLLADQNESFPYLRQYYEGEMSKEQFMLHKQACIDYIENSGCIEYTRIIQELYVKRAEALLDSIDAVSPWKEQFKRTTFAPEAVTA